MRSHLFFTNLMAFTVGNLVLVGLYLPSLYSYLLLHTLVVFITIPIAGGIFILTWNTRPINDDSYLSFIGIAYVFVAVIDLIQTLAYIRNTQHRHRRNEIYFRRIVGQNPYLCRQSHVRCQASWA